MCAMDQIFMAFSIVNIHKMVFHAATMGNSGIREKFRINYGQIPGYTVPFNKDDAHVAYHMLFKSRYHCFWTTCLLHASMILYYFKHYKCYKSISYIDWKQKSRINNNRYCSFEPITYFNFFWLNSPRLSQYLMFFSIWDLMKRRRIFSLTSNDLHMLWKKHYLRFKMLL